MRGYRLFDFEGGDPDPRHLEHVVGAPAIDQPSVLAAFVFVAGAGPGALEGGAALVSLVPISVSGGVASDQQFADLADPDFTSSLIDKPDFIARNGHAAGSINDVTFAVRQEDMQHLGRPDTVEDVDTGPGKPAFADGRRKRFARRNAKSQRRLDPVIAVTGRQHGREQCRHTAEQGRAFVGQDFQHPVRRGPSGKQQRRGADRHREGHGVAKTVGKEDLCRRIDKVILTNTQHLATIGIRGGAKAAMNVCDALRLAGGPG